MIRIWLSKGLAPDPIADGHVDGIAAFVKPGTVLLHRGNRFDPTNRKICREAKEIPQDARDATGRKLRIIDLPLYRSHMNF